MVKVCPSCGYKNRDGNNKCVSCGNDLSDFYENVERKEPSYQNSQETQQPNYQQQPPQGYQQPSQQNYNQPTQQNYQQPQQQNYNKPQPQNTRNRICPQCGRQIEFDVKFCPHCGKDFGEYGAFRNRNQKEETSAAWWLLPIFFSWLGGLIGYLVLKDKDREKAKKIGIAGIVMTILWIIISIASLAIIM